MIECINRSFRRLVSPRRGISGLLLLCLTILLAACRATPYRGEVINEPVDQGTEDVMGLIVGDRSDELLVLVAFSGGGTRAAALAFGVLQALAESEISTDQGPRRVLDEIDVISSVSGGSFISAYFGLFGDRIFDDFAQRFLLRPVESDLAKGLFYPRNWQTLGSPNYGRSDMAAAYYDEHIFENKTFADLHRPGAPLVVINATDLSTGSRVTFSPAQFKVFCIDLDKYPVSRAVAASSAVPGIASPITLKNYGGQCGYELPTWALRSIDDTQTSISKAKSQSLVAYSNANAVPWIHLIDGGVADNLGLRAFYTPFSMTGGPREIFRQYGHEQVRQVLMISVNAAVKHEKGDWLKNESVPSAASVLTEMSDIQMERYTADTLHIVRASYQNWVRQYSSAERPVSFDFVEINFGAMSDADEQLYLYNLPTSMELEDEQVERLISAGRQLMVDSPEFQRFMARNPVPPAQ